jgi:hypothetical protein
MNGSALTPARALEAHIEQAIRERVVPASVRDLLTAG